MRIINSVYLVKVILGVCVVWVYVCIYVCVYACVYACVCVSVSNVSATQT